MTTNHIDALATIVLPGAVILGNTFSSAATKLIAEANGAVMPDWVMVIVGPLGALAALAYGLKWMTGKLEASEKRADQREAERNTKLEQVEKRADERESEYKAFIEKLQEKHADKLEVLTLASMKVTDKVANSIDALVRELDGRPCGIGVAKNNQRITQGE